MRASRLLSILMLLQTRGQLSATELAQELEVSVRTVYRDADSLSAAGIPIYAERGAAGGYRLLEGYRTRLTGLTPDEAETLLLGGLGKPLADLGLSDAMANAQLKILAAVPPEFGSRAKQIRERLHLDAQVWFQRPEETPYLQALAGAVWEDRRIWMRYERTSKTVEREANPLGLVLKAGVWYLVAAVDGSLRTYRVGRVTALDVYPETFERPEGFELASYWQEWSERFEHWVYREEAVVRFSPWALDFAPYIFNPEMASAVERQREHEPDAEGWVTLRLPIESVEQAPMDLLRLGADVEVLEPVALRTQMREIGEALARRYAR